jgi:type II secretory pathway predicted ATPase ExeA
MYQDFFGFREPPFRITPDPRVLYRNRCYDEAIAALAYGIDQRKGFMSLVGEVGTGKTTLLRHVLESVSPNVRTVLLLYPTISFEEILEQILLELGVPLGATGKGAMLQRLHEYLLEHTQGGGNVALLFDEAQALDTRTLEELRLISNFETGTEKIVQLVLAGQPELEEKLRQPEHRQLRQRIALHVRLRPLNAEEVADYVRVRLEHVDAPDLNVFTPEAVARIAELTAGIPRLVNVLCDACCTTAFALGRRHIDRAIVDETWVDYAGLAPETAAPTASPEPFLPPPPPLADSPAEAAVASTRTAAPPAPAAAPPTPPPPPVEPPIVQAWHTPDDRSAAGDEDVGGGDRSTDDGDVTDDEIADDDQSEERSPVMVAFVVGVVLAVIAALVVVRLVRRVQPEPDLVMAPTTTLAVAGAPNATAAMAAPTPPAPEPDQLSDTPATPAIVSDAPPTPPRPAGPPAAPGDTAPTAVDALDLVDDFRRAYEQRNVERLGTFFAPDARKGDLAGRQAIIADYQRFFTNARDLLYSQPTAAVEPHGDHVIVRAPFQITYKDASNRAIEVRGTAAWTIARRDGSTLIRSLDFELSPVAAADR